MADSCRVRAVASEEVSRGQVVGGRLWGNGGEKNEAFLDSCCNNVNKCLPLSN